MKRAGTPQPDNVSADQRVVVVACGTSARFSELTSQLARNGLTFETADADAPAPTHDAIYVVGVSLDALPAAAAIVDRWSGTSTEFGLLAVVDGGTASEREELFHAKFDDVVTLPISHRELAARTHALARRLRRRTTARVVHGRLILDPDERILWDGLGAKHTLTPNETALMQALIAVGGRTVPYSELFRAIWHRDPQADGPEAVRMVVKRLRRKVAKSLIETVNQVGLRLSTASLVSTP